MKKISGVFDGFKFANSTLVYAVKLAESGKALVFGIFLKSSLYNSYQMGDLIGSYGQSHVKRYGLSPDEGDLYSLFITHH